MTPLTHSLRVRRVRHLLTAATIGTLGLVGQSAWAQGNPASGPRREVTAGAVGGVSVTDSALSLPRWATIRPNAARTRAGPGRNFPIVWEYHRSGLPVQIIASYESWRKIRDPDGATGWIQGNLLSSQRGAVIIGKDMAMLFAKPDPASGLLWRAEPGVSGQISQCAHGWCHFEVGKRGGFIASARLWGVAANEVIP